MVNLWLQILKRIYEKLDEDCKRSSGHQLRWWLSYPESFINIKWKWNGRSCGPYICTTEQIKGWNSDKKSHFVCPKHIFGLKETSHIIRGNEKKYTTQESSNFRVSSLPIISVFYWSVVYPLKEIKLKVIHR